MDGKKEINFEWENALKLNVNKEVDHTEFF